MSFQPPMQSNNLGSLIQSQRHSLQQKQVQKLILSQHMKASLALLQMDGISMREYLQEKALSNPLLSFEESGEDLWKSGLVSYEDLVNTSTSTISTDKKQQMMESIPVADESFIDSLHRQWAFSNNLSQEELALGHYLIDCLDERGYLSESLASIAKLLAFAEEKIEFVLTKVQELSPSGVAARCLEECLCLQLERQGMLTPALKQYIDEGLMLLAEKDWRSLSHLLNRSIEEVQEMAQTIMALNPIPSQGCYVGDEIVYQYPEAEVIREKNQLRFVFYGRQFSTLSWDVGAIEMLEACANKEAASFLKKCLSQGNSLMRMVDQRNSTIEKLVIDLVNFQEDFFLFNAPLKPITMEQLSVRIGCHTSTVSRAVKNKIILFENRYYCLESLFASSFPQMRNRNISSDTVKRYIKRFVEREDVHHPLSDESMKNILEDMQIYVSRRAVTKYRKQLGIPSSFQRKAK